MSKFSIDQQFEAIIIPTGSFLILHQLEDSISALQCFYQHLEEKG